MTMDDKIKPENLKIDNPQTASPHIDNEYNRRFAGTKTLYGADNFAKFAQAHVIVIGVGGVGTWVVEGLARTGVGKLTLVDLDVLVASNVNRQLPALDANFGRSKIEVMGERAKQINPHIEMTLIDDFLTADNVGEILTSRAEAKSKRDAGEMTVVLDCCDDMSAKLAIALHCRFNKLKLIVAGGAGGKIDPLQITTADLKDTHQDPLLARMRSKLRHEHGINSKLKEKFGIKCVYSTEPPKVNTSDCEIDPASGLRCGGYGSAVAITSVIGMVMVNEALQVISRS